MAGTKTTKMIPVENLYLADNPRRPSCERIPEMVDSLRRNGFKENHPLVVSEKPDGRFLVLCGNRRTKGLQWLQANDTTSFAATVPGGKVPAIVHKGLTEDEEILLRIDHSPDEDRVPLDEFSEFQAIKQLLRAYPGDSQATIAEKLGIRNVRGKNKGQPNRPYVQTRVSLARLPSFVQEEYRKYCESGKDATHFRLTDVKELYTLFNEEFETHPDGDGPKFRAKWGEIMNPALKAAPEGGAAAREPVVLKPEDAKKRAQVASSKIMRSILLAVTGQGGDASQLDNQLLTIETDAQILADIRDHLGPNEYAKLVNEAREARIRAEEMSAAATSEPEAEPEAETVGAKKRGGK